VKKSEVTVFREWVPHRLNKEGFLKLSTFMSRTFILDNRHSNLTKWKNNESLSPRGPLWWVEAALRHHNMLRLLCKRKWEVAYIRRKVVVIGLLLQITLVVMILFHVSWKNDEFWKLGSHPILVDKLSVVYSIKLNHWNWLIGYGQNNWKLFIPPFVDSFGG
jgi:hypothetical protein